MAEYDIEQQSQQQQQAGVGGEEGDGELFTDSYNDYGASEEQDELMDIDDVPVSQEDAWAVIS